MSGNSWNQPMIALALKKREGNSVKQQQQKTKYHEKDEHSSDDDEDNEDNDNDDDESVNNVNHGANHDANTNSDDVNQATSKSAMIPSEGTLVVCPASLIHQWAKEVEKRCSSKLRLQVNVYHGPNR